MKKLKNKRALVTGASSGIGKAIALALGEAGADVMVHYKSNQEEAQEVVKQLEQMGVRAHCFRADLSKPEDIKKLYSTVENTWEGLDILVANAGIQKDSSFMEMSFEDWKQVIDVNLTGQFLCAQEAVKLFHRKPQKAKSECLGNIIFMNSVHQIIPWAGRVNYAASKGGLKLLMESLAQEVSQFKIRVNAIAPGAIKTDINKDAWDTPEKEKELLKLIPYGRVGVVEDVAQACVWLASSDSDYVIGTTLYVDGGMTLYPEFAKGG